MLVSYPFRANDHVADVKPPARLTRSSAPKTKPVPIDTASRQQVSGRHERGPGARLTHATQGTLHMVDHASAKEISRFFDRFVEAFATFDGTVVGRLFVAPGVALKQDGTLQGFSSQEDVEAYYQAALDHYRASGCRSCRYSNLEIRFLNDRSVIATASWDLLHQDGSVINHWRQAYFMSRFGGEWRIFRSTRRTAATLNIPSSCPMRSLPVRRGAMIQHRSNQEDELARRFRAPRSRAASD